MCEYELKFGQDGTFQCLPELTKKQNQGTKQFRLCSVKVAVRGKPSFRDFNLILNAESTKSIKL